MDVQLFPTELADDRYVIALVVGLGVDRDARSVSFQVDCCGIGEEPYPQAFVVKVPVDSFADVSQLTMHQHFRVILDESRKQPEYIELSGRKIVRCEVTHMFGESRKDFEFIC